MSEKRLIACGTMLKQYNEEFDVDIRAMHIKVGSDEVNDFFESRPAVPYHPQFPMKELTTAHLSNAFAQSAQLIEQLKNQDTTTS